MPDVLDNFRRFEEAMNRMFEEVLGVSSSDRRLLPPIQREEEIEKYRRPFIDVVETDKDIVATAEMPGLEKGDIKINLTDDRLEISAETKHEEEKKDKGYVYRERRSGSFYRSISLPSQIDPDNSKASYSNGVLEVKMPKTEIKKKTPVKID